MFEDVKEIVTEEDKSQLHFYYNREERITKAPQNVKDYYDGKMKPVKGIRILVAFKPNRFILISLVLFIGFVWVYNSINTARDSFILNGIVYSAQSFCFEEEIYLNLKIKEKKENNIPVKVNAKVQFINADNQIVDEQELYMVYDKGEKYLRTKHTDYDIIRIDVLINANGEEKELSSFVKR